jgi:alpha-1,6-mannosyltransferase
LRTVECRHLLIGSGVTYLIAILVLVISKAPLGSATFFAVAACASAAYGLMLARIWRERHAPRRLLIVAFAFAIAFRVPSAIAPVNSDNDMVRYLWDGRIQRLGYNPYAVVPSDPALIHTHTDQTARMPSRHDRTPYPPAAQLFFRWVVTISDSPIAMKLALVACDLLTILVVWRWLTATGRSEWLTLAYAWNPLVVLEVAHSGHLDALGALWIAASAFWLSRRRTLLASLAFVLAVASKLVPVVLFPLFIGRVRPRDVLAGGAFFAALYLPFVSGLELPLGNVPNVVDRIRFNGPIFAALSALGSPRFAAAVGLLVAISAAAWARWRLEDSNPAAWAWPMALAIACAPVIYPWYLIYLTPFLFTTPTLPLTAWTISALWVYHVWDLSRQGARWIVPTSVMCVEFAAPVAAVLVVGLWWWRERQRGASVTSVQAH